MSEIFQSLHDDETSILSSVYSHQFYDRELISRSLLAQRDETDNYNFVCSTSFCAVEFLFCIFVTYIASTMHTVCVCFFTCLYPRKIIDAFFCLGKHGAVGVFL